MGGTSRFKLFKLAVSLISLIFFLPFCQLDRVMNIIRQEHFPCEKHKVETQDGYVLTIHRIPQQKSTQNDRKIILLMHGISDSAQAFLDYRHQKSTAFELNNAGFDVWMINARGNVFSRHHINMTVDDPSFWDFSWHEIGVYDLPATIDYILEQTNQTKLAYAGVSQGGAVILVTLSEKPQYNKKIIVAQLMAPAVILKHFRAPFPKSVDLMNLFGTILRFEGVNDLTPNSLAGSLKRIAPLCITPFASELCRNIMFTLFGPSIQYFDEMLLNISDHYPAGSSYKQFIHYGQLIATGKFQKFHYNETKNMEMYGSQQPPEYDLSKITANIHILYGTNDRIAPAENIPLIADKLGPSLVAISKFPGYNHIDFTYGRNLKMVHKKMFKVLNRYC